MQNLICGTDPLLIGYVCVIIPLVNKWFPLKKNCTVWNGWMFRITVYCVVAECWIATSSATASANRLTVESRVLTDWQLEANCQLLSAECWLTDCWVLSDDWLSTECWLINCWVLSTDCLTAECWVLTDWLLSAYWLTAECWVLTAWLLSNEC